MWIIIRRSNISNCFLSLLDEVFKQQVVTGTDVVMLVGLDTLSSVVLVDIVVSLHAIQDRAIDWNRVDTNFYTLEIGVTGKDIEPRVLADLVYCVSFLRVSV